MLVLSNFFKTPKPKYFLLCASMLCACLHGKGCMSNEGTNVLIDNPSAVSSDALTSTVPCTQKCQSFVSLRILYHAVVKPFIGSHMFPSMHNSLTTSVTRAMIPLREQRLLSQGLTYPHCLSCCPLARWTMTMYTVLMKPLIFMYVIKRKYWVIAITVLDGSSQGIPCRHMHGQHNPACHALRLSSLRGLSCLIDSTPSESPGPNKLPPRAEGGRHASLQGSSTPAARHAWQQ